jgi:hypothetical protein
MKKKIGKDFLTISSITNGFYNFFYSGNPPENEKKDSDLSLKENEKVIKLNYCELPCSEECRKKIDDLITGIASDNLVNLLLEYQRFSTLGKEIDAKVYPLKFLEVIFTDKKLKEHLISLRNDFLKWPYFLQGIADKLDVESKKEGFSELLKGFSEKVNVPLEKLQPFCDQKEWQKLIDSLIDHSLKSL